MLAKLASKSALVAVPAEGSFGNLSILAHSYIIAESGQFKVEFNRRQ